MIYYFTRIYFMAALVGGFYGVTSVIQYQNATARKMPSPERQSTEHS